MTQQTPEIGILTGIRRGMRHRCPICDTPGLFVSYLGIQSHCARCGAENGKHRVDDVASYFTVLLVGHLIVAPSLAVPLIWTLPLWASLGILLALVTAATLAALPFVKGGVVGALAITRAREAGSA